LKTLGVTGGAVAGRPLPEETELGWPTVLVGLAVVVEPDPGGDERESFLSCSVGFGVVAKLLPDFERYLPGTLVLPVPNLTLKGS